MSRLRAARSLIKGISKPIRNLRAAQIKADRKVIRAGKQLFGKGFEKSYRSASSYKKNIGRLTTAGVIKGLWDDRRSRHARKS